MERRLLELLGKVFYSDGLLIPKKKRDISEDEQKELIKIATSLYPHLGMTFGNAETGKLDFEALRILRVKLTNLKSLYDVVFTFDGEIKACGRSNCLSLIEATSELYPEVYFGETKYVRMNSWKLLEYRDNIFVEYNYASTPCGVPN